KVKESKRNKNKLKDSPPKIKFAEFVSLTQVEYDKLISTHSEERTKRMIEILDNYKGANNKKYASDYRAILNWVVKRVEEEERRHGGSSGLPKYQGDSKKGYGGSDRKITRYDQTSNVREFSDEELAGLI
ncbi:MAG UNVERIFIED_CONTAM: hypothetical protein MIN83_26305, partial [Paenibacillus polymyxa]